MTIKQLYPTQRPALDLNFARQKRLDSRVTFTRGSTATYFGSDGLIKTAASGEARFDHDPATGESLGLLVEESRTNLLTYSQEFDDASWKRYSNSTGGGGGLTIIPNSGIAPDGTYTAYSSTFNLNDGAQLYKNGTGLAGVEYTLSIWIRANSSIDFTLFFYDNISLLQSETFSSSTEWQRFTLTKTYGSGSTDRRIGIANATGSFYLWGAQLEAGSFPTSYIPTTSSTVTRSADVANLTNSSIYDTDSFTILNEPFGSAAGGSTLSLVGAGKTPIKRTAVYSQDLTQTQINASVGKTDEFWRWRILGSSFGLPSFTTDGQVTVDWGDGTVETLTTSDHTFTDGGGYHDIGFRLDSGTYFRPYINNNASHDTKVVAVGPAPESMTLNGDGAFYGCESLEAFDATVDASVGNTFFNAWRDCTSLTSFPLIDTSSGTIFFQAWYNCPSLTSFPLIDTSSGTNFYASWYNNNSLTSFPLLDTSSGVEFSQTWGNCTSLTSFPAIDASSGTNFTQAWFNCTSLTSFPLIDTSSGTNFSYAWYNNNNLTSFPSIDTSSGTNFGLTWNTCNSLTSFPLIDTSSGTSFQQAWQNCTSLTSFPAIDTSSGINFAFAWNNCNSLTSFPLINTSNGTSVTYAWQNCTSLTSFPLIDTSSVTNFGQAWYNCSSLTSFPLINTSSGTNFNQTWIFCSSLTSFPAIDTSSGTDFSAAWYGCNSLTSFPSLDVSNGTTFNAAWFLCSSLANFPANFFDSWTGTPGNNCFESAWYGCVLTATSVENILNSIDTSGRSAPASGVNIAINYNTGTGTPSVATAVTNLKSRGWTITLNGVAQ